MNNKGPLQKAAEADIEVWCQHVDRLRALKTSEPEAYKNEIKELGAIAIGRLARTSDRVSADMAGTILDELEEYDYMFRPEIVEVLRNNPDPEYSPESDRFMGSRKFVPLDEAERSGDIPKGYL